MRNAKHSPPSASQREPELVHRHELAERLGWTGKHLLSQARPAQTLDLARLASYRGLARR